MNLPASLRQQVVQRADRRCEYCGLAQIGQEAIFHVDHITPLAAGGETILGNLALACVSCSLRKGARQRAIDPVTGALADLFHPRHESWRLHFRWEGFRIVGLTPAGRATVAVLSLNRALALAIRKEEFDRFRHPPPGHL